MKKEPSFPGLAVSSSGYVAEIKGLEDLTRCSLYGLAKGLHKNLRLYDCSGLCWEVLQVKGPLPMNFWTRLLAQTVYNPRFQVKITWKEAQPYTLDDLKLILKRKTEEDDDILTQFTEADQLKGIIEGCKTFEELLSQLRGARAI